MPTPGRAHPGHGHAVRLCRAHGISHAHGELATPPQHRKKDNSYLCNKVTAKRGRTLTGRISVSSHNHAPLWLWSGAPIFANNDCQEVSPATEVGPASIVLFYTSLYCYRFSVVATGDLWAMQGFWLEIGYQFVYCRSCFLFTHRIVHSHISYGYKRNVFRVDPLQFRNFPSENSVFRHICFSFYI